MRISDELSGQRERLLQALLEGGAVRPGGAGEGIQPRSADAIVPLSPEQSHIVLHTAMADSPILYNEVIVIRRTGGFRIEVLEQALNEVLRRHEIWRSSVETRDGRLQLIAHPGLRVSVPLIDLSGLPAAEAEATATRLATEDARRPFDLAAAPLLRGRVVRIAPEQHRLYLTLHHIIFDGVSIHQILMRELPALYAAFDAGVSPDLPEPALQYGDYAVWRERQLTDASLQRDLDYWRKALAGDQSELVLPSDRPAPPRPSHRGGVERFELPSELVRRLRLAAAQDGVTQYVMLLAAFKALLHRYSGQDEITIGGVVDTRHWPKLEGVIGYFVNGVALHTRPRGETRFRDYLAEVSQTVVSALDASNAPFDHVIRALKPKRRGARHPLFQVLFSIQPPSPTFAPGWDLAVMDVAVGTAKYDLYLELEDRGDRLVGQFLYSVDLFDPPTIRRMIDHWRRILEAVAADTGCRLSDLPLLSEAERQQVLAAHNTTDTPYRRAPLHTLVAAQAAETPGRVALEWGDTRWTYAELDRRSNALAAALAQAGAAPGALVGVAMERGGEMVAGLLATLKAGAAYLPLDPALPEQRLALLIEDARPKVILADAASSDRLPADGTAILICEDVPAGPTNAPPAAAQVTPEDPAYVLFTSGSTGRPKAVEVPHGAVANLLEAVRGAIDFAPGDSLLALTTLSFDIAALELFLPLVSGGRVVIGGRDDATDPSQLAALIERSGCNVMQATPATWRGLIAGGWPGAPRLKALCGGERLSTDLARALLRRCAALWNMYGPTETTIWSLCHRVGFDDDPVPIGRPLANTQAYIVDAAGAPLPDLAAGELLIGGDGLACGYRGAPELTAARFVTPDWLNGERVYRTGDRARRRADGVIEFLGRTDNQVKVRGFRVGLEEVEAMLGEHPKVAAAAARAWPDPDGETILVGYVTGEIGPADIPDLRRFLRERAPAYMIPSVFEVLAAMPTTSNGKVDRGQLPRPSAPPARSRPPAEGLESELADLWKDTLGLTEVGAEDSFFDLGGHSLLAAALMTKIEAELGQRLPLAALFEAPTIAGLAEALSGGRAETGFTHVLALRPGRGRPFFIVHGIFGNVVQLKDLAEAMATPRPVLGIQALGADLDREPHETLEAMVTAYVAAVREVQPMGPYALAGYSFGGLIAFEMARRLRAEGEVVELLALLETNLNERFLSLRDKVAYNLELASRVVRGTQRLPVRAIAPYLGTKLGQLGKRALLQLGLRNDFMTLDPLEGPIGERRRRLYEIGVGVFRSFNPGRYDGVVTLVQVRGPRFGECDPVPIWRRVAGQVEVVEIDGQHGSIIEKPYVGALAAELDERLAAAERQGPPSHRRPAAPLEEPVRRARGVLSGTSALRA